MITAVFILTNLYLGRYTVAIKWGSQVKVSELSMIWMNYSHRLINRLKNYLNLFLSKGAFFSFLYRKEEILILI